MTAVLQRLRFPVADSRGRRYPEAPHPYRNDFQRDRDRIVHARAFRRLEHKTQVFSAPTSDHFRNRLTHTIEVAQIARTVAASLGLEEDLTEALALAHDFGHPPFAHAGEAELNRQMARFGDRFDHNLHALRLVESFEQRYARFPGLNLTFEVREGMVKHSRDFGPGEFPELDAYLPGLRPPLEAQLIDLADEIAYNTADLDDAFDAGMLTLDDIVSAIPKYADIQEAIDTQFPGAPPRIQFLEGLRLLIDWLVTGLIQGTLEAVDEASVESVDDVRRYPYRLARLTPGPAETSAQLKRFLYTTVYNAPALQQEREHSTAQVAGLFNYYLEHHHQMPEPYATLASEQPTHRVVCDYIAGMTDGFLRRTVRQLQLSATPA